MSNYITGLFLAALLTLPGTMRAEEMSKPVTSGEVPAATSTAPKADKNVGTHKKAAKKKMQMEKKEAGSTSGTEKK